MKTIEYPTSIPDGAGYDYVDIEDEIVKSVLASPHSKMLFRMYDNIVELEHKEGARNTTGMDVRHIDTHYAMQSLLRRSVAIKRSGYDYYPRALVKKVMGRVTFELPRLDGFVGYPIITKSGDLVTATGYNAETNLFVGLDTVFDGFAVPDHVLTNEDIARARQQVSRAFAHVPMSSVNQSKHVAALLTLVMRDWFDVAPLMCFVNKGSYCFDEYDLYLGALFLACDGTNAQHVRVGRGNYMGMVHRFKQACENGHTSVGVESLDFVSKKAIQDCLTFSGKQFNNSNLRNASVLFTAATDKKFVPEELKDKTLLVLTNKVTSAQRVPEWVYTHDNHEVRVGVFQGLLMLVSSWLQAGCPAPTTSNILNPMFDDWYNCVAGVLEHNGYPSISL
jgi:hypothetical protein